MIFKFCYKNGFSFSVDNLKDRYHKPTPADSLSSLIIEEGIDHDRFISSYYRPAEVDKVEIYDMDNGLITTITPEMMPFWSENKNEVNDEQ